MLGTTPDALAGTPVLLGIINTNSPLQLDVPMAEGLIALATHGQVNVITPFTLPGSIPLFILVPHSPTPGKRPFRSSQSLLVSVKYTDLQA